MKICPKCGTEVEDKDRFCTNCGYQFDYSNDYESDKWVRQQHKEFDEQPDEQLYEQEPAAQTKGGSWKKVTIIVLLLIIIGAASGVIYGFISQL